MSAPLTLHDFKCLLRSAHPIVVVAPTPGVHLRNALLTAAGDLGRSLMTWTPTDGLVSEPSARVLDRILDPVGLFRRLRTLSPPGIVHLRGLSHCLGDATVARSFRELTAHFAATRSSLVVSQDAGDASPAAAVEGVPVSWRPPPAEELAAATDACLRLFDSSHRLAMPVDATTREAVAAALEGLTVNQARQAVAAVAWADGRLTLDSLPQLVEWRAGLTAGSPAIELFPAEDNRFELAGFGRFKGWMPRARAALGPEAAGLGRGLPRSVLLAGVEGCGKSLAVRVLARECRVPLVRCDAAKLDRGVGPQRSRLQDALDLATAFAPSILWVDGLEHLVPDGIPSSGLRWLLDWVDAPTTAVLVAATTGDLWAVPPQMLGNGAFDDCFFVDLPDAAERDAILRIHVARRRQRVEAIDVSQVVDASEGCAGRDIEQAIVAAIQRCAFRGRQLDTDAVLHEFHQAVPLSATRGEGLDRLREMGRGRFVPAR